MVLTGWIIYNGFLQSDKFLDLAKMIQQAASAKGHQAYIYKNNELLSYLSTEKLKIVKFFEQKRPDYVVFTDKDIYLAKQLELLGIRVFNSSETIEISDDKIKTYQLLASENITIPKTIIAPKAYSNNGRIDQNYIQKIINTMDFPFVLKEAFGSFGEQVYLIHDEIELLHLMEKLQGKPYVFQEFIKSSYGVDLRLQVVGNEVVAAMKRTSDHDFRANVTSGGKMKKYVPTKVEKEVAIKAAEALGADFAGVDLLFGQNGEPIVCEVNSNAHIRNLLEGTGINVADYMIDYIMEEIHKPSAY